ncbi:MAG: hypothetical protein ABR587_00895 [Candidatus Binatia bacterium]
MHHHPRNGKGPLARLVPTTIVLCLALAAPSVVLAGALALVVTNVNDSGPGSLRAAIEMANTNSDPDTIVFDLPKPVQPIQSASTLAITAPVTIDGYTQADATPNTLNIGTNAVLKVVIDGSNTPTGGMFQIDASNVVLRGLVLSDARGIGVQYSTGDNGRIEGCFIGTNFSGTVSDGGGSHGIFTGATTTGITIGGPLPAQRNIVSGNSTHGMRLTGDDAIVQGNLVGTDATGTQSIPNGFNGISVEGENVVIGSDVLSGPGLNVVRFNADSGIAVSQGTSGVTILGNHIDSNGDLGINLATPETEPVTPNDINDTDTGANDRQNFPVIGEVLATPSQLGVFGRLDVPASANDASYTIRVFWSQACDSSGHGEGRIFVGAKDVLLSNNDQNFSFTLGKGADSGDVITATATDNSTGNTSEFSKCYVIGSGPAVTCGDVTGDDYLTAPDALSVLRAAVGSTVCELCVCDVNDSEAVTTTDALAVLRVAVGQSVALNCPPCD